MPAFNAAAAINQLGLDLYRQISPSHTDGNLVLSPYSISEALTMVAAGADGTTRDELVRTLHHTTDETEVLKSFATLRRRLGDSAQKTIDSLPRRREWIENAGVIEWQTANRLFGQAGHPFYEEYLQRLAADFGASLESLDFKNNPSTARVFINQRVAEKTRKKIQDLIPPSGITEASRLVLVNALYFKAPWDIPFKERQTKPAPFAIAGANSVPVPTMAQTGHFYHSHENQLTTVALPFEGAEFQLLIFLPDRDHDLKKVAAALSADALQRYTKLGDKLTYLSLWLPKFKVSGGSLGLRSPLRSLHLRTVFDEPAGSANFGRIAPRQTDDYLGLSDVFHRTFLAVEEGGVEAAAATAVAVAAGAAAMPPKPTEVRIDRPFLFAIQHVPTGLCLFFGHIGDPR